MKKNIVFALALLIGISSFAYKSAQAGTYSVTPKVPAASTSTKPGIIKYKQQNYVGAMQDLEATLKKEPNNDLCKYYLALSYSRLGYSEKATALFQEISDKSTNSALKYYAKYALDCTGSADGTGCKAYEAKPATTSVSNDDMTAFIRSGQKIHPSAMDKITNERMMRKVQEAEYLQKQQEANNPNEKLKSQNDIPTNEEVINAINTLKKVGIDPISTDYTAYVMEGATVKDPFTSTTEKQFDSLNKYSSPEYLKMLMLGQITEQNNLYSNMFTYGI